jgi:hypothetical protein
MMDINIRAQQTTIEFNAARRKAFLQEMLSYVTGRPNDLLSFEEVRQSLRLQDSTYKGLQEIELDKIVGSVGRYRDFTRTFLPKSDRSEERWRRVDAVTHDLQGTPPIEVFKIGDVYFVRDGNHRVSVARTHGASTIEAYVIEYKTPVHIENTDELDDILLKVERTKFLRGTKLNKIRPGHKVEFTEPGRYRFVGRNITFHKYLRETELGRELTNEEAVASWYDNVYTPIVNLIRERDILNDFPGRTEADLYAWFVLHRAALEEEARGLGSVDDETVIEGLEKERNSNPLKWLIGLFRKDPDLPDLPLMEERAMFLEKTRLNELRPGHEVEFTEPGAYQLAQEHIRVHKYLKEKETGHEVLYDDAVASWYDTVYLPIVTLIEKRNLLKYFPGRLAGDLYIWFVSRRAVLEQERDAVGKISDEEVIDDLEQEGRASTPMTRLARFLWEQLE